jgi:hypothetical protein
MIELYTQDNRIARLVREAAAGVCEVEVYSPDRKELAGLSFDLAVTAGRLDSGIEKFAAQHGAPMVVVMPEAGYWMCDKAKRDHLSVIGSDYRSVKF